MRERIAIVPSNQHQNTLTGIPGGTEEKFALAACAWLVRRLGEYDCDVASFHVPGRGAESTDELAVMIDQALAWKPTYVFSLHSDAVGDQATTGILMLMARPEDAEKGQHLGRLIAERVGLPYKATWVYGVGARKIMYLRALRDHSLQGSLVEVGEHATAAEAAWNWAHVKEVGVGVADALAEYLGLTLRDEEDDMTDEDRKLLGEINRLLKLGRVSDVARSYDMEIIKALARGDEDTAAKLELEKDAAVETERKALGL